MNIKSGQWVLLFVCYVGFFYKVIQVLYNNQKDMNFEKLATCLAFTLKTCMNDSPIEFSFLQKKNFLSDPFDQKYHP